MEEAAGCEELRQSIVNMVVNKGLRVVTCIVNEKNNLQNFRYRNRISNSFLHNLKYHFGHRLVSTENFTKTILDKASRNTGKGD